MKGHTLVGYITHLHQEGLHMSVPESYEAEDPSYEHALVEHQNTWHQSELYLSKFQYPASCNSLQEVQGIITTITVPEWKH
jgi:hypothetical protein